MGRRRDGARSAVRPSLREGALSPTAGDPSPNFGRGVRGRGFMAWGEPPGEAKQIPRAAPGGRCAAMGPRGAFLGMTAGAGR